MTIRLNHEVLKIGGQLTAIPPHRAEISGHARDCGPRLPPLAGQPDQPGFRWQRLPGGDGPRALPSLRHVGHAREQAAQLDCGRQLAALIEGGSDGGGFCLGDDEHVRSMGRRTTAGKLGLSRKQPAPVSRQQYTRLLMGKNRARWQRGLTSDPSKDQAKAFSSASCSIRLATVPRYPHIRQVILIAFKVDVAQPLDAVQYLPFTFTTLSRSLHGGRNDASNLLALCPNVPFKANALPACYLDVLDAAGATPLAASPPTSSGTANV